MPFDVRLPAMSSTTVSHVPAAELPAISRRRILLFWLPLAASWLLMGAEMPFLNAAIARLGEAERMLAAFGIVGSLSITIESPVIMLLTTSTALARGRQSYRMLRKFTWHLMLGTTVLHLLIGWTPLFDVVVREWMGVPEGIVEPVRLGMRIMVLWSAAIAWRRFKQGVMIRFGLTRFVGAGTLLRLMVSAGTGLALALPGRVPGVAVAAYALSTGVIAEAAYAHWVTRGITAQKFGPGTPDPAGSRLGYAELVRFHWPLAASTLLYLLSQPLIAAALARGVHPELTLAAWPVASGLLFITRAPVLALPEVVIALIDENGSSKALRDFCVRVGLVCSGLLGLIAFTPLAQGYFRTLMGVNEELASRAVLGGQIGLLLPLVYGFQSWLRGYLSARRATGPMTLAMILNLLTMAGVLFVGVALAAPGVALAAFALTLAAGVETVTLWRAARALGSGD